MEISNIKTLKKELKKLNKSISRKEKKLKNIEKKTEKKTRELEKYQKDQKLSEEAKKLLDEPSSGLKQKREALEKDKQQRQELEGKISYLKQQIEEARKQAKIKKLNKKKNWQEKPFFRKVDQVDNNLKVTSLKSFFKVNLFSPNYIGGHINRWLWNNLVAKSYLDFDSFKFKGLSKDLIKIRGKVSSASYREWFERNIIYRHLGNRSLVGMPLGFACGTLDFAVSSIGNIWNGLSSSDTIAKINEDHPKGKRGWVYSLRMIRALNPVSWAKIINEKIDIKAIGLQAKLDDDNGKNFKAFLGYSTLLPATLLKLGVNIPAVVLQSPFWASKALSHATRIISNPIRWSKDIKQFWDLQKLQKIREKIKIFDKNCTFSLDGFQEDLEKAIGAKRLWWKKKEIKTMQSFIKGAEADLKNKKISNYEIYGKDEIEKFLDEKDNALEKADKKVIKNLMQYYQILIPKLTVSKTIEKNFKNKNIKKIKSVWQTMVSQIKEKHRLEQKRKKAEEEIKNRFLPKQYKYNLKKLERDVKTEIMEQEHKNKPIDVTVTEKKFAECGLDAIKIIEKLKKFFIKSKLVNLDVKEVGNEIKIKSSSDHWKSLGTNL